MIFLLLAVPIVEIVVAAVVAHSIGWWWTLLALSGLSLFGVWQFTIQGLGAWRSASAELRQGASPARAVIGGALRVLGAVLFIVPGFLTAAVGLLLLIGPIRGLFAGRAGKWAVARFRLPSFLADPIPHVRDSAAPGGVGDIVDVDGWEEPIVPEQRLRHNVLSRPGS